MSKVIVTLSMEERDALVKLALASVRSPRDQARYIIVEELRKVGILSQDSLPSSKVHKAVPQIPLERNETNRVITVNVVRETEFFSSPSSFSEKNKITPEDRNE